MLWAETTVRYRIRHKSLIGQITLFCTEPSKGGMTYALYLQYIARCKFPLLAFDIVEPVFRIHLSDPETLFDSFNLLAYPMPVKLLDMQALFLYYDELNPSLSLRYLLFQFILLSNLIASRFLQTKHSPFYTIPHICQTTFSGSFLHHS
jgi:hypothetical protein